MSHIHTLLLLTSMKGIHKQQKENLAQRMLSKRVSSSATSHHVTQDSTTHQPTPMGNWCSSNPYSFKNNAQIEKHQHRSTVEAKRARAEATQAQQSQGAMQGKDPPRQSTTTFLPPLHCLQPLLLWLFKFSTDSSAEPIPVYLRHVS